MRSSFSLSILIALCACGSNPKSTTTLNALATVNGTLESAARDTSAHQVAVLWAKALLSDSDTADTTSFPVAAVSTTSTGTTYSLPITDLPPDTLFSTSADGRMVVGSVVVYDDSNGNGKIDLLSAGATTSPDHVLGVSGLARVASGDNTLQDQFVTQWTLLYCEGKPFDTFTAFGVTSCAPMHATGADRKAGFWALGVKQAVGGQYAKALDPAIASVYQGNGGVAAFAALVTAGPLSTTSIPVTLTSAAWLPIVLCQAGNEVETADSANCPTASTQEAPGICDTPDGKLTTCAAKDLCHSQVNCCESAAPDASCTN